MSLTFGFAGVAFFFGKDFAMTFFAASFAVLFLDDNFLIFVFYLIPDWSRTFDNKLRRRQFL